MTSGDLIFKRNGEVVATSRVADREERRAYWQGVLDGVGLRTFEVKGKSVEGFDMGNGSFIVRAEMERIAREALGTLK